MTAWCADRSTWLYVCHGTKLLIRFNDLCSFTQTRHRRSECTTNDASRMRCKLPSFLELNSSALAAEMMRATTVPWLFDE